MGKMQDTLESLLGTSGSISKRKLPYPRKENILRSGLIEEVSQTYKQLGGILEDFELNLRSWDMEFEGVAVELDESLHFNRYRLCTLSSSMYLKLSRFPLQAYTDYCSSKEINCLSAGSYGGKWTNTSTERQYGPPGAYGDLNGAGSPRWKQRAFYDFVKDLSTITLDVTVVRIAIWDFVFEDGIKRTVEEVLKSPSEKSAKALFDLIETRIP